MTVLSNTAQKALEAYGGQNLWQNIQQIDAVVSGKGLAFILKRRPYFDHVKLQMEVHRPYCKITPIGKDKNISAVLDELDVHLEDTDGKVIAERKNARKAFALGRRTLYWDDIDMGYFANYAFWNYFTLPALLMNQSIEWTEIRTGVLKAVFPTSIPTHSTVQEFRFDTESGLLLQHNYAVDIISSLANAANVVHSHKTFNGLPIADSRVVSPQSFKGKANGWPVLIDLKVHDASYR